MEQEFEVFSTSMMNRIMNLVRRFEGVDIEALASLVSNNDQGGRIQIMVTGPASGGYYPGVVVIKPSLADDFQKIGDDGSVRVKSNSGELTEDEVYDCHFIGTTNDYYILYETLRTGGGGGASLAYDHWVLEADFTSTAKNTETKITGWQSSVGSTTSIQFPSTGFWKLDFLICSTAYGDAAMDLTLVLRVDAVLTKAVLITPQGNDTNTILLNSYYSTATDAGIYRQTAFSMIVQVTEANADAVELYGIAATVSASGVNWSIADRMNLFPVGAQFCTWILGQKLQ